MTWKPVALSLIAASLLAALPAGCGSAPPTPVTPGAKLGDDPAVDYLPDGSKAAKSR